MAVEGGRRAGSVSALPAMGNRKGIDKEFELKRMRNYYKAKDYFVHGSVNQVKERLSRFIDRWGWAAKSRMN